MTSIQKVIQGLSDYWGGLGCALLPPCTFEVPLGLLHPEAFFRLLDPGAWRAAFLQPISRPADGRGGSHPFRTGRHLQFQVVWKGGRAANAQESFVACLKTLGLDLARRDLRFLAGPFEVAALGARGRGWRVELEGLALGRITFLESLADRDLDSHQDGGPASFPVVEMAFGVERLTMALRDDANVFDLPWLDGGGEGAPTFRTKRRENEEELFQYFEEVANVGYLRQMLDGLDREARRCLEAELPRPAYELAIRILPILDQLDIRGDLDLRERDHWLHEVRQRVEHVGALYAERFMVSEGPIVEGAIADQTARAEVESRDPETAEAQAPGAVEELVSPEPSALDGPSASNSAASNGDPSGSPDPTDESQAAQPREGGVSGGASGGEAAQKTRGRKEAKARKATTKRASQKRGSRGSAASKPGASAGARSQGRQSAPSKAKKVAAPKGATGADKAAGPERRTQKESTATATTGAKRKGSSGEVEDA